MVVNKDLPGNVKSAGDAVEIETAPSKAKWVVFIPGLA
jgi:hypothetical protein